MGVSGLTSFGTKDLGIRLQDGSEGFRIVEFKERLAELEIARVIRAESAKKMDKELSKM